MRSHIIGLGLGLLTASASGFERPELFTDLAVDKQSAYIASEKGGYSYDGERFIPLREVFQELPNGWCKKIISANGYIALVIEDEGTFVVDTFSHEVKKLTMTEYKSIQLLSGVLVGIGKKGVIDVLSIKTGKPAYSIPGYGIAQSQGFIATKSAIYKITNASFTQYYSGAINNALLATTELGVLAWFDGHLNHIDSDGISIRIQMPVRPLSILAHDNTVLVNNGGQTQELRLLTLSPRDTKLHGKVNSTKLIINDSDHWSLDIDGLNVTAGNYKEEASPVPSNYNFLHVHNKKLYLGSRNYLYAKEGGKWKLEHTFESRVTNLQSFKNELLIGTAKGLFSLGQNSTPKQHTTDYVISLSLASSGVLVASNEDGVYVYDGLATPAMYNKQLPQDEVLKVVEIEKREYVATNNGIYVFQAGDLVDHIMKGEKKVTDIVTHKGTLYVSTFGNGLFKQAGEHFEKVQGSPSIISELDTFNQNLVVGANDGLYLLDEKLFYKVGESTQVTANSIRVVDQSILYGTTNKVVELTPDTTYSFKPYFTGIISEFYQESLPQQINVGSDWAIFLSSDAAKYQPVSYQYNLGDKWIDAHSATINVRFTDLGNHTIKIRASSDGANWTEGAPIKLNVVGPWYYSTTAKALFAAVALALFGLIIFYYRRRADKTGALLAKNLKSDTFRADQVLHSLSSAHAILVANNGYLIHDAMAALQDGIDTLLPDVQNRGGLAGRELAHGLDAMIVQLRTEHRNVSFDSDIAINNKQRYNAQFESSVYMVLHHAVQLAVARHNVSKVHVAVYKDANTLTLSVIDNGALNVNPFKRASSNALVLDLLCNEQGVKPVYKTFLFKRDDKRNVTNINFTLPTPITQISAVN